MIKEGSVFAMRFTSVETMRDFAIVTCARYTDKIFDCETFKEVRSSGKIFNAIYSEI